MKQRLAISIPYSDIQSKSLKRLGTVIRELRCTAQTRPQTVLACLSVEVTDLPDKSVPLVLLPGFVEFARKLRRFHGDFGFYAEIGSFYRNYLFAIAGNVAAAQRGEQGSLAVDGSLYLPLVAAEVDSIYEMGVEAGASKSLMEKHREEMSQYLLGTDL